MRFSERPMLHRVRRGIKVGAMVATFFSIWAAVAFSLKSREQLEALHLTLPETVAAYFAGGLFGGAFVGVAFPLARWAVGAFALGFIANLPTTLVMGHFIGYDLPLAVQVSIGCITACIGGTLALYIRSDPWPE